MGRIFNYLVICVTLAACDTDSSAPPDRSLQLIEAFPNLNFTRLVDLQSAGDEYFYAVEQPGRIRVFLVDSSSSQSTVFLDIQDRVDDANNEEGLLGLDFHPQYPTVPYFYVNYTSEQSTTRISRFEVDPNDPFTALPSSELILVEFNQPFENHNGGQVAFGPDGYLYIAVGDGGSAGDPQNHGQDGMSLLGTVLRIDINETQGSLSYAIPNDNPFINNAQFRDEIFAYGLRNPWRMSFDDNGQLWVADVGQAEFEEINIITSGGNYGWNVIEGPDCFQSSNCDQSTFEAPYFFYEHDNGNLSVTGGYVYQGPLDELKGQYIYADFISGRVWGLTTDGSAQNQLLVDSNLSIASFGVDHQDELYLCSLGGQIYRLVQ